MVRSKLKVQSHKLKVKGSNFARFVSLLQSILFEWRKSQPSPFASLAASALRKVSQGRLRYSSNNLKFEI
jgi:hypothetical protein